MVVLYASCQTGKTRLPARAAQDLSARLLEDSASSNKHVDTALHQNQPSKQLILRGATEKFEGEKREERESR